MSSEKTAFLFPGQGSQYVGMGREFIEQDSTAVGLMEQADQVSGFPIGRLCLDGPLEELTRTVHLQPAITVLNLITLEAVRGAGIIPDCVAGHSLGEYSAMVAAGVTGRADTLRLVTERGRLMEREAGRNPGGMQAVLKLDIDTVREVVETVRDRGVITIANHNSARQVVVSGEAAALKAAAEIITGKGGRAIPLPVSGAWHSDLVAGAIDDFSAFMKTVEFREPELPLLFNVTAAEESDPHRIRKIMSRQIASTVRWYEIIEELMAREIRIFIEVGPKKVLAGLLKKIIPADYPCRIFQVDSPAAVEECRREITG